jgi:hypothetical protein
MTSLLSQNLLATCKSCSQASHPGRRNLSIKPVLFVRKRSPRLGHAHVALESGLAFGALCKMEAVFGVVSEYI